MTVMRPITSRLAALLLATLLLAAAPAWGQARRLALVIGNNKYNDAPLQNPVNDARAMARSLEAAGFEVILRTDATQREMLAALRDFGSRLKDSNAGLFYFAGHGMQIKGRNFLIPVGADIQREDEVAYQSLDAQAVLDKMESAGNGTNLMILDACRNNPFARSFRSASQGLAQMDAPVGTMVAFATAPGSVASDGQGSNGLYTQHLLGALQQPGLKVEDVFKQVRSAVRRDSKGAQVPWESTSLEGDFYFVAPRAVVVAPPPDPLLALDDAMWDAVKDSAQPAELQFYLRRFPSGRHAEAARERAAGLATAALPAAPSPLAGNAAALGSATLQPPITLAALAPSLAPTLAPASTPAPDVEPVAVPPDDSTREERAIAESVRRIADIVRWGDENTDRRPATPQRNPNGFTEGDRYRWRIQDRMRNEFVGNAFCRIDRIEDGGALFANDGALQFDRLGHLTLTNDTRRGSWERWSPALQTADIATRESGFKRDVEGLRETRDSQGLTSRVRFSGSARHAGRDRLVLPAGSFDTVRVELSVSGDLVRSDGSRGLLTWRQTIWYAPAIGLPVAWELDERIDGRIERRLRQELTALDVDGVTAAATATAGR